VFPGSQKPYYLKSQGKSGGTYVRIGSTDKPASEEMREELERQRRKISFDAMPVFNLFFAEVDLTQFKNDYRKATGRTLENDQLKNMGLLFQDRDQWFPPMPRSCYPSRRFANNFFLMPKSSVPDLRERTQGCFWTRRCKKLLIISRGPNLFLRKQAMPSKCNSKRSQWF
jgi:hypothetical protein